MRARIEELEKRLEAEPENVEVMIELASLYGEENQLRKGTEILELVIGIDPENAAVL
ncbi:MAG: hypothetical protein ACE5OR_01945 [bacterium]